MYALHLCSMSAPGAPWLYCVRARVVCIVIVQTLGCKKMLRAATNTALLNHCGYGNALAMLDAKFTCVEFITHIRVNEERAHCMSIIGILCQLGNCPGALAGGIRRKYVVKVC